MYSLPSTVVERHGRLDITFNNAGIAGPSYPITESAALQYAANGIGSTRLPRA